MSGTGGRGTGRRRLLAATGAATLGAITGCLSLLDGGGYRVRLGADADWRPLTPVETGSTHRNVYCGGEEDSCETARHGLDRADTVSMFVHRHADGEGPEHALVVTYDTPDDSGGTATLQLDETISVEEDLIVADGPVENSGSNADSYESDRFVHNWADDYTDGAVIALDALSTPTLEFGETEGLDEVLVFSGTDPESAESYGAAVDTPVSFEF
jgi:hypothetical protein